MRLRDLVRPVDSIRTSTRLLNSRIDRERKAAADSRDAKQLPSGGIFVAYGLQQPDLFQLQILGEAHGESVGHVEAGWPLFGMGIEGILRVGTGDRAGGVSVGWNSTCIVKGFRLGG